MKNKKLLIGAAIAVLIILLGGGTFFAMSKNNSAAPTIAPQPTAIPQLSADELGITLTPSTSGPIAGHGIVMKMTKLDGVTGVECELMYNYTYQGNQLQQDALCRKIEIKPGAKLIEQEMPFGTESSGHYHFDTGVINVKMIFKVTKADGKIYSAQASL